MPKQPKMLKGLDLILTILRDAGPAGLHWTPLHREILIRLGFNPDAKDRPWERGKTGAMLAPKPTHRGHYAAYFSPTNSWTSRGPRPNSGVYLQKYVDHTPRGPYILNVHGLWRLVAKGL